VDLVISTGQPVAPNVVGQSQASAVAAITAVPGLSVGAVIQVCSDTVPAGDVISQSIAGGTTVSCGTAVDLTVSTGPCPVSVPDVVGMAQGDAASEITSAGLAVGTVTSQCSDTVPAGSVISQSPGAGASVPPGTAVDLTVSTGLCPVTVPDVVGMAQGDAEAEITSAGLAVGSVITQCSDTAPAGSVISQSPAGGASVPPGTAVDLTVSTGPCPVTVPDVVGMAQGDAASEITSAGLAVGAVTQQCSDTVPAGSVITQSPAGGASVPPGTAVDLTVSTGPCPVTIPDVVGMAQGDAEVEITSAGLAVGTITTQCNDSAPAGSVISQSPAGGASVPPGTAVDLTVSTGPCPVSVPDVVGMAQGDAEAEITSAGLVVGAVITQCSDTVPAGSVITQSPVAGASVPPGTAVDLTVSTGPCPVTVPDVVGQTSIDSAVSLILAGLTIGSVAQVCSDTVPAGYVTGQDPAGGAEVLPGTPVNLSISAGRPMVPYVSGQLQASAEAALTAAGLTVGAVTQMCSDTVPAGNVISQSPAGGATVSCGAAVDLTVSTGPCQVTAPDVVGMAQGGAEAEITAAGLAVGTITTQCSDTVPAGQVISQSPAAGTSVLPGTAVDLVVSAGQPVVPDVVGQTYALAEALLTSANLTVGTVTLSCSDTVPAGDVIIQDIASYRTVPCGTAVDLIVSAGQPVVPDVEGQTYASAEAVLASANLSVGAITHACSETVPVGYIISQSISGGMTVPCGTAVGLVISEGQPMVLDVVGQSLASAEAMLASVNLAVGTVTQVCSNTVPEGSVISVSPTPGTLVPCESAVHLEISTGPCPVAVPDVTGQTGAAAVAAIVGVGLTVGTATPQCDDAVAAGSVISQSPAAGVSVQPGTAVDLVVSTGPCPVTVPDVVGMAQGDAEAEITSAGLAVGTVTTQCSDTVPAGSVISQSPAAGTSVQPGLAVNLVISSGPCNAVVPDVVGLDQAAAEAAIDAAGLVVGAVTSQCSDTIPAGSVISQDPIGSTPVTLGSTVDLVVSSGPCLVTVPDVVGLAQGDAEAEITSAGLAVGAVITQCSDTVPAGSVISQSPAGGASVLPGTVVDLTVSTGPCLVLVNVPDVTLYQLDIALLFLNAVGLLHATVEVCDDNYPAGTVLSQDPAGGLQVPEGSTVTLTVSSGPCNAIVPDVVGQPQAAAEAAIDAAGLALGTVTTQCDDTVPAGSVISQTPAGGTPVTLGSAVDLVVSSGPCPVPVPDVTGQTESAAAAAITGAGLAVGTVTTQCSDTVPAGSVISQNPVAGTSVESGSAVDLVISSGPCDAVVPDVVGLTLEAAQAALSVYSFSVNVSESCSDTVPAGSVISQSPAGGTPATQGPGTVVNLAVSTGPCPVTVPDVTGQTESAATAAITGAGLAVGTVTQVCSDTVPAGQVISQNPAAGTSVQPGSAVDLVISSGPCVVPVPNVVGQAQAAAQAAIEASGLAVGQVTTQCSDTVPAGDVISQNPDANTQVAPGSAVSLVVSAGPAVVPNVVGQARAAAAAAITAAGLTVGAVQEVYSTQVPAGTVITQSPAAGVTLTCGAAVNLLVSKGALPEEDVPTNREIMKQIHDQFEALDANGDGKLSLEEAQAALPMLPWEIFDAIDADGDGSLTLEELKEYLKISGCFGCIKRLFVKDLLVSAGGDLLLAGLGLALLGVATLRRRSL